MEELAECIYDQGMTSKKQVPFLQPSKDVRDIISGLNSGLIYDKEASVKEDKIHEAVHRFFVANGESCKATQLKMTPIRY